MRTEEREELQALGIRVGDLEKFMRDHTREESARVKALEAAQLALKADMAGNTASTNQILDNTSALIEFIDAYKATKLVGQITSKAVMYLAVLGAAIATIWYSVKVGKLP